MSDSLLRPEVSYFDKKSADYRAEYDRTTPEGYSFRVRRGKVLELTPRGTNVVDIASGPGIMISGLRAKGCTVTCVDAAPEMIARTKEEHGSEPGVRALVGDAYSLPLGSGEFDVALSMGLIEYLERERDFLQEARRVLKQGGTLIITFPNYASPWRALNRVGLFLVRALRAVLGRQKIGPVTHREYTRERAYELLRKNGFAPEQARYYNFKLVPYPFDVWFPRITVAQSRILEPLDRTFLRWLGTGFIVEARKTTP
ncbi:MAG: class I SAM-dependent methyltransferase [Candidatus Kaiserbacteria bacterium]|nr:MAG: class I SAM-dependent methyltransferase [Candidatus Kaiserbacteria bacterium]